MQGRWSGVESMLRLETILLNEGFFMPEVVKAQPLTTNNFSTSRSFTNTCLRLKYQTFFPVVYVIKLAATLWPQWFILQCVLHHSYIFFYQWPIHKVTSKHVFPQCALNDGQTFNCPFWWPITSLLGIAHLFHEHESDHCVASLCVTDLFRFDFTKKSKKTCLEFKGSVHMP